jgi:hypothetical protein
MKMTRIVSKLMSQIRAQKIRRGTITKVKTPADIMNALMAATLPFYGFPVRVLDFGYYTP